MEEETKQSTKLKNKIFNLVGRGNPENTVRPILENNQADNRRVSKTNKNRTQEGTTRNRIWKGTENRTGFAYTDR